MFDMSRCDSTTMCYEKRQRLPRRHCRAREPGARPAIRGAGVGPGIQRQPARNRDHPGAFSMFFQQQNGKYRFNSQEPAKRFPGACITMTRMPCKGSNRR